MTERIIQGDALEVLKTLESESVDCVITSPPYFGLRDYGVAGQLGLEETPDEFIEKLVGMFSEVRRVLKKEGTLWCNLGDSYNGNKTGNTETKKNPKKVTDTFKKKLWGVLKPKDMMGIPWRVAFALQADGWYLRQDIIWAKPNPMPESVTDRCTKSHEYIFLLSKSQTYFFDSEAIKEKAIGGQISRPSGWATGSDHTAVAWNTSDKRKKFDKRMAGGGTNIKGHSGNIKSDGTPFDYAVSGMRNRRSVWNINPHPFAEAHFATFPEKLVEPMILAGCPKGGTVLDPFSGAATTGVVAKKFGRNYIGIELSEKYCELSRKRLARVTPPML